MPKATTNSHHICQDVLTAYSEVGGFLICAASDALASNRNDISVAASAREMSYILSTQALKESSYAVILEAKNQELRQLQYQLNHLSEAANVTSSWQIIHGDLSEQELAGDAPSELNQTIHRVLRAKKGLKIISNTETLLSLFPSREDFQAATATLQVGEQHTLRAVLEILTGLGYVRYDQMFEMGGFRVRGEQVDVRHFGSTDWYTVTFFGNTIESIVHTTGRRSTAVNRLHLWPVRLPAAVAPLSTLLAEYIVIANATTPATGALTIRTGAATPTLNLPPLPDIERCLPSQETTPRPVSYEKGLLLVAELESGKPAVYTDHGIGIFDGLQLREIDGGAREYLVLRYAGGDTVSVPVEYAHKVTAYAGEGTPPLDKLGGTTWKKASKQAQIDAEHFARELLKTAGKRTKSARPAYVVDPELDDQLTDSFPFNLTEGQLAAWEAVKEDLVSPQPMDHLVVGDVGFGKTEIALRAARHVINNGKQVALLAPTTLLVQQHKDTAHNRLSDITANIGTLSRFSTATEARQVRERITKGTVTLAIGTHALLSEAVAWHDLGLVIIDEEQRFGVTHKEHFKKIRAGIDVLSLSATPIPRTLSMALSGLKNLSVISTPPAGRQDVTTTVTVDNDDRLQAAIEQELKRKGQVYVVAPKIRQLPELAARIEALVPSAKYATAHGQLPSKQLANIMHQFDEGTIDILISSTIIENGIDLPNANTIIVTHATRFGLSDLYQLRGRVGRRRAQGHAHFLYNQSRLTIDQRNRLAALTEAARLGAGWSIAQRDLEIRGAGNLLGAEQSGSVNAVGVQLYLDLVQEALSREERHDVSRHDVDIRLPLTAQLPPNYVPDEHERSRYYQRLARAKNLKQLAEQFDRLAQRFGEPPREVTTLHQLLALQHHAARHGITIIESQTISPPDEDPYARLLFTARDVPRVLDRLNRLGNPVVRHEIITWDVDQVDEQVLAKLNQALQ